MPILCHAINVISPRWYAYIQIQCCYSFIHSFIHSFTFKGVFLIQEHIYSHLRDVFIHIERVIYSFSIFCAPPLRIIRLPSFRFQSSIWQMKAKDPKHKVLHWQDLFSAALDLLQECECRSRSRRLRTSKRQEYLFVALLQVLLSTVNSGVIWLLHGQWIRHDSSNCTNLAMYSVSSLRRKEGGGGGFPFSPSPTPFFPPFWSRPIFHAARMWKIPSRGPNFFGFERERLLSWIIEETAMQAILWPTLMSSELKA